MKTITLATAVLSLCAGLFASSNSPALGRFALQGTIEEKLKDKIADETEERDVGFTRKVEFAAGEDFAEETLGLSIPGEWDEDDDEYEADTEDGWQAMYDALSAGTDREVDVKTMKYSDMEIEGDVIEGKLRAKMKLRGPGLKVNYSGKAHFAGARIP